MGWKEFLAIIGILIFVFFSFIWDALAKWLRKSRKQGQPPRVGKAEDADGGDGGWSS